MNRADRPPSSAGASTTLAALSVCALFALLEPGAAYAQSIPAPYAETYRMRDVGSVTGVPENYGGVVFKAGDPNTLLIGGAANVAAGRLYQVQVVRDAGKHIVGFGAATQLSTAPNIDGGLTYGPEGILFFTRYPRNEVGQILPGSQVMNKSVLLSPLQVSSSVGALQFVPEGFPGAGRLKTLTFHTGHWNDVTYQRDANGTYDLTSATRRATLTGGPEGLIYVPLASPEFGAPSVLVCEYGGENVVTYQVDAEGDAIVPTRKVFISEIDRPEGAAFDPVTRDFVFTAFGNRVLVVGGFSPPPQDTDHDGVADPSDNCPTTTNADQLDTDGDRAGDACDGDDDNDGFGDVQDAFPTNPAEHKDSDGDGVGDNGDRCPLDRANDGDGDERCADVDLCPEVYDPDQADFDQDGIGDLCDDDRDGDGVSDAVDLCLGFPDSVDADGDGIPDGPDASGAACDLCPHDAKNDAEGDGLCADVDNCPVHDNADQADFDDDTWGDSCDDDDDNDGVGDPIDRFPNDPTEWADSDSDGVGDNGDLCHGSDASGDSDLDRVCDDLDALPDDPGESADSDGDGVGDNADAFDDDPTESSDADLDGIGDNADACWGQDPTGDSDDDAVCDDSDLCPTDPVDADEDGDLVCDVVDACVGAANVDADGDQVCDDLDLCTGNDATGDTDFDGFCDGGDVCPVDSDPDQSDGDGDGIGDACEGDRDKDGVLDDDDVCVAIFDPDQANTDLDSLGDACDLDDDNDTILDANDNCPLFGNRDQRNTDHDAFGDVCDGDDDADGVLDLLDQCQATPLSVLFDSRGCSGVQRIARNCGGPRCTSLRGQIQYIACVVQNAGIVRNGGLITSREKGVIIANAVFSCWCGN